MGAVGSRLLLNRMGVLNAQVNLEDRAVETIAKYKVEDPRESPTESKFGGPTRHKRVFSYAEFHISAAWLGHMPLEGARLQENGARGPHADGTPLIPVPLPINQRVERNACSEFLLLSGLCTAWEEAGAVSEVARNELTGTVRLYSTGPSCLSCCAAVWQFSIRFPRVEIEMSYSTTHAATLITLR